MGEEKGTKTLKASKTLGSGVDHLEEIDAQSHRSNAMQESK